MENNTKAQLRAAYLKQRMALTEAERHRLNDLIMIQLQRIDLPYAENLLNYMPLEQKGEPNTFFFSHYFRFLNPGLRIAYPVSNMKDYTIEAFYADDDTEFERRAFDLVEPLSQALAAPEDFDIIIVPMIVADEQGYRVGYGKGMYDKYLKRCRKDVFKIGFSFFPPVAKISDIHQNDIPLDVLVYPDGISFF